MNPIPSQSAAHRTPTSSNSAPQQPRPGTMQGVRIAPAPSDYRIQANAILREVRNNMPQAHPDTLKAECLRLADSRGLSDDGKKVIIRECNTLRNRPPTENTFGYQGN